MVDDYIIEHPSYQYAKDVVDGKIISGKYIFKECQKFLNELENEDSEYFLDIDTLEMIDGLTRLINMPDGVRKGQSAYDSLGGFQWYFIVNVLCWKHKSNPEKRKYEKSIMLIGRKNGK